MGSDSTSKWGLNYPASTDPTNVPGDIEQPIAEIDALLAPVVYGTLAARPAAGKQSRWYFANDGGNYGLIFQDTGSAWVAIGVVNSTINPGVGSPALITSVSPGNAAAQGGSGLAAAADHGHSMPGWGSATNIQPVGSGPNAGSSNKFADAEHIHPGASIGDVTWSLNPIPPSNGLIANGQAVSQTTYATLYALATSQSWPQNSPGAGNFNVIDLRDKSPIGAGLTYALGQPYGAPTVALTIANLPPHIHNMTNLSHFHGGYTNVENQAHVHTFPGSLIVNLGPSSVGLGSPAAGQQAYGNGSLTSSQESSQHTHNINADLTGSYASDNGPGNSTPFSNVHPVIAMTPILKAL
jgi:microcystin-dependent protein